jgi:hypothetical protein
MLIQYYLKKDFMRFYYQNFNLNKSLLNEMTNEILLHHNFNTSSIRRVIVSFQNVIYLFAIQQI